MSHQKIYALMSFMFLSVSSPPVSKLWCHWLHFPAESWQSWFPKWKTCRWTRQSLAACEPSSSSTQVSSTPDLWTYFHVISAIHGMTLSLCFRRKRSFQPIGGRGAKGKSLRLFGVVHQAEIPRPARQVGREVDRSTSQYIICFSCG